MYLGNIYIHTHTHTYIYIEDLAISQYRMNTYTYVKYALLLCFVKVVASIATCGVVIMH